MKAVHFHQYGGPDILEQVDVPMLEPGPGQILVRVFASSVNPLDWKIASGKFWPFLRARFPQIPGCDVAGEVVRCGVGVTGFSPGSRIHACVVNSFACAEYTLLSASMAVCMPDSMDFPTAAALPLAGMTALQGLRDKGGMSLKDAQQRVLIIGASGGVGHLAVQIACAAGATVIGVCSAANGDFVKSLGAHQVIDYNAFDPYKDLLPCDLMLDCVGQPVIPWIPYLTSSGRFISIVPHFDLLFPILKSSLSLMGSKKIKPLMMKPHPVDLRILDDLFSSGQLKVHLQRFSLDHIRSAWEQSLSGRTVGKIVIDVVS